MSQSKITKRDEDYSKWYQDIIEAADLAEHSPVKGCMVIKPYGYAIWENIQAILNKKFKENEIENAYFPLFIPYSFLEKEKEHIEGFSPELAIVTHAGGEKLEENLVIRPTSETIIGEMFSKWIKSYRDLPLQINQWANVVRWELRTRLFLRTSEFLWQEGHTAHATKEEAEKFAQTMLNVYLDLLNTYLAISPIAGEKSKSERFAGADNTYTLESIMQDGKALQSSTSHMLGQNFSKALNIQFLNNKNELEFTWQTSWGISTRIIGGLIMSHSDDNGLVLPPLIAPIQVVILPIVKENAEVVMEKVNELKDNLIKTGITVKVDSRDYMRLGEKIFEWEKKGVPLRVEIGEKDLNSNSAMISRRDELTKESVELTNIIDYIQNKLNEIQKNLLEKNIKRREENTLELNDYNQLKELFSKESKFILTYWCEDEECEKKIKEETKATTRCIPFNQKGSEGECIVCKKKSTTQVIIAKAY